MRNHKRELKKDKTYLVLIFLFVNLPVSRTLLMMLLTQGYFVFEVEV